MENFFSKDLEKKEVSYLIPGSFEKVELSSNDVMNMLKACSGAWFHPDPPRFHALLTGGKHSNGYFNLSKVFENTNVMRILAIQLAKKLKQAMGKRKIDYIDWVIGAPYGAISFSAMVAEEIGIGVKTGYCEKTGGGVALRRFDIPDNSRVLIIEDLVTTGGTVRAIWKAIKEKNEKVEIIPLVGAVVHRPPPHEGVLVIDEQKIYVVSLLSKEVSAFSPGECPWCKQGSVAVRPKENWKRLVEQR